MFLLWDLRVSEIFKSLPQTTCWFFSTGICNVVKCWNEVYNTRTNVVAVESPKIASLVEEVQLLQHGENSRWVRCETGSGFCPVHTEFHPAAAATWRVFNPQWVDPSFTAPIAFIGLQTGTTDRGFVEERLILPILTYLTKKNVYQGFIEKVSLTDPSLLNFTQEAPWWGKP